MKSVDIGSLLLFAAVAALLGTAVVFLGAPAYAGVIGAVVLLAAVYSTLIFRRYKKIGRLAESLNDAAAGREQLRLEEYQEGELSVLASEIYKLTVQLREQAGQLREDKLFLEQSLSDISHQLKTPLTSLSVMNELLHDEDLPAKKRKEFLDSTGRQLERLDWLLSALLKMARLDAGTVRLVSGPVGAIATVRKAAEHLLIPMELKDVRFVVEGDEDAVFLGDASWTREAFANFLKNSVEHTNAGGSVTVTVSNTPLYLSVVIADTGCGISKKDMPHIFERFYRGENSAEDSVGIGLNMAKSIITRENGTITVESKPGEGTKFIIKFYGLIK